MSLLSDKAKGLFDVCEIDGTVIRQLMITKEWSEQPEERVFLFISLPCETRQMRAADMKIRMRVLHCKRFDGFLSRI